MKTILLRAMVQQNALLKTSIFFFFRSFHLLVENVYDSFMKSNTSSSAGADSLPPLILYTEKNILDQTNLLSLYGETNIYSLNQQYDLFDLKK